MLIGGKTREEALRHVGTVERIRANCVAWIEVSSRVNEDKFVDCISGFSQETLDLIEPKLNMTADGVHPGEFSDALATCNWNETAIREYVTYASILSDCEDYAETFRYIEGLRHYPKFRNVEDLSTLTGDDALAAHGLLKIALYFHVNDEDSFTERSKGKYVPDPRNPEHDILPVMKSSQIAKLVVDNPQRANTIFEYISERGIKSPKVLADMVENTHGAVSDGFL